MATLIPFIPYLKQDGTARVYVKLTHNRKRRYITTDIYVTDADLTRKHKVRSHSIQLRINQEVELYRRKLNDIGLRSADMTVDQLHDYLIRSAPDFIDLIRFGRTVPGKNISTALNSLCRFTGLTTFDVNDLTVRFLQDYETWLRSQGLTRAVSLYTGILRKLLNDAKRVYNNDDNNIILVRANPFLKYKVPLERPKQRSKSIEQIRAIRDSSPRFERGILARNVFMLSFYLCGMNAVDLYNCKQITDVITYERTKTRTRRKDKALMKVRIEPECAELIRLYKGKSRVFNFSELYSSVNNFNAALNKGLKYIEPDLTFYAARHSWATIARNDAGIDKYTVHEALNHVDDSMRVTDTYITRSFQHIWAANRKVLDAIR